MLQHTPTHTYYTTRIACPGVNVGSAGDWSVVALDTDGSTDWIITGHNFNSTNGMNSPIIYNDGWWHSHPALFNEENDFPVVTYDDQGNIFVGWTFNNLSNNHATTDAIYPIVLQCDYNGDPIANIDYWDVPVSLSSSDVKNCISLSGRHANDVLFCTYLDDIAQDVYTKAVTGAPASGSLKVLSSNNQSSGLHELYLTNDFMILGKLYDLKGKLLFHYQGSSHDFMKNTLMILNNRKKSVYLIAIISNDGKYVQKTKIFAGE